MSNFQPSTVHCRDCNHEVSTNAQICPHCGAPCPYDPNWNGYGYEYQSITKIWGMPLIHIAFGKDKKNKWRIAKGFIAIGQYARGVITIAQFGIGIISISQFGIGLIALSQFGIAVAIIGQLAVGFFVVAQMGVAGIWGMGQYIIYLVPT
jgi:hypothetical protein